MNRVHRRHAVLFFAISALLLGGYVYLAFPGFPTPPPTEELYYHGLNTACPPTEPDNAIPATVELETSGTTMVEVTYHAGGNASFLTPAVVGPVHQAEGFTKVGETESVHATKTVSVYKWDGDTENPSLRLPASYAYPPVQADLGPWEGDDWTIARSPLIVQTWVDDDGVHCTRPFPEPDAEPTATSDRELVATDFLMYLGDREPAVYEREVAGGTEVSLIVPPNVWENEEQRADETLAAFERASLEHAVGCHRDMTVFVLPGDGTGFSGVRGQTLYAGPASEHATVWVDSAAPLTEGESNVWMHEYVHTRQCFSVDEDMQWFVEGSASYYDTRLAHQTDLADGAPPRFDSTFHGGSGTLSNPADWSSEQTPYGRGAEAAFYLDYQLRNHGDRTLDDAVRWMNDHNSRVTYDAFRAQIVAWTDEDVGEWMDTHIAGDEPIETESAHTSWYADDGVEDHQTHTTPTEADNAGDATVDEYSVNPQAGATFHQQADDTETYSVDVQIVSMEDADNITIHRRSSVTDIFPETEARLTDVGDSYTAEALRPGDRLILMAHLEGRQSVIQTYTVEEQNEWSR